MIQNLKDKEVKMMLVFTPAAARSGQGERAAAAAAAANTGTWTAVLTEDGIEVRVHPLAYSIGTLFSKGAPPAPKAAVPYRSWPAAWRLDKLWHRLDLTRIQNFFVPLQTIVPIGPVRH